MRHTMSLRTRQELLASVRDRPRLCEKSVRNEAVGKLFNFPLRLAVKRDEEWDCASKSGGFVSIFPTGDMTPDFLHSLGRFETIAAARFESIE